MAEERPYILKLVVGNKGTCEKAAQEWIDSFGKLGYIPIKISHGNSFADVSIVILFKKEA